MQDPQYSIFRYMSDIGWKAKSPGVNSLYTSVIHLGKQSFSHALSFVWIMYRNRCHISLEDTSLSTWLRLNSGPKSAMQLGLA